MAKEIERKYLVKNDNYKRNIEGKLCKQGYLTNEPDCVVRIRIYGEKAFLTVKNKTVNISRDEYEYEIDIKDAQEMLSGMCKNYLIEKFRYEIEFSGNVWVVDEFIGNNKGLIIAEIELFTENQTFACPDWVGEEISKDFRYSGTSLSAKPYIFWDK